MFPLSCREDDLGKGKKKKGTQLSQCAPKQRCVCSKAGSTRRENTAMPHVSSLQLLSTAQKGAETRSGGDMGQLCIPTVPACSSASNLPAEPGKAGEDHAETVFQSCRSDTSAHSATPRHSNLAALQHELAAGRTSHLCFRQLTMLQGCSLSGEGLILEFLPSQDPKNSLSLIAAGMAQCSLHKAKPALCLTVTSYAFQPNLTYPKHIPKKKQEEAAISPP